MRRLRQLYPDVRCKVLYQRDYLNLLVKYGLEEPSQLAPAPDGDEDTSSAGSDGPPSFLDRGLAG